METVTPAPTVAAGEIAAIYQRNTGLIHRQTAGLTHTDSLIQPQPRGNCLNWVLGHIAVHRDIVLGLLGQEPVLDETETRRYTRGSEPVITDGPDVLPLDRLLAILDEQLGGIVTALDAISPERFTAPWSTDADTTVSGRVAFFAWHDTYHLGQTDQLRQLAGTDDSVIP